MSSSSSSEFITSAFRLAANNREFEIRKDELTGYSIFKVSQQASQKLTLPDYVRGLIFDEPTERIICPGLHATVHYDADTPVQDEEIAWVTHLIDGVTFRVYWSERESRFVWSTNGMIIPNKGWSPHGKTFNQMFLETIGDNFFDGLDKNICYRFNLIHKENPIFSLPTENQLILTGMTTMTYPFREINPTEVAPGFLSVVKTITPAEIEDALIGYESIPILGVIYYTKSGRAIRRESSRTAYMVSLRVNSPDPVDQWLTLLDPICADISSNDWERIIRSAEVDIVEYLRYFPWHTQAFNAVRMEFFEMVSSITDKITTNAYIDKRFVKKAQEVKSALEEDFVDFKNSTEVFREVLKMAIATDKKELKQIL